MVVSASKNNEIPKLCKRRKIKRWTTLEEDTLWTGVQKHRSGQLLHISINSLHERCQSLATRDFACAETRRGANSASLRLLFHGSTMLLSSTTRLSLSPPPPEPERNPLRILKPHKEGVFPSLKRGMDGRMVVVFGGDNKRGDCKPARASRSTTTNTRASGTTTTNARANASGSTTGQVTDKHIITTIIVNQQRVPNNHIQVGAGLGSIALASGKGSDFLMKNPALVGRVLLLTATLLHRCYSIRFLPKAYRTVRFYQLSVYRLQQFETGIRFEPTDLFDSVYKPADSLPSKSLHLQIIEQFVSVLVKHYNRKVYD
ncbi:hypothetical protein LguiA_005132 [Lonicera macranthoides]